MWVRPLGREDPLEEEMATHSSILLGESHGQRILAGYSPWGHKESDTTERLHLLMEGTWAWKPEDEDFFFLRNILGWLQTQPKLFIF